MESIGELLKEQNAIKVFIPKEEYIPFLFYAKGMGFLWRTGEIIQPEIGKPLKNAQLFVLTKEFLVFHPCCFMDFMRAQGLKSYQFQMEDVPHLVEVPCKIEVESTNEEFSKLCKSNRERSLLQVQNGEYFKRLPQKTIVQCENPREVKALISFLCNCGYENQTQNQRFIQKTKQVLLIVDRTKWTIRLVQVWHCIFVFISRKKLYKAKELIEMRGGLLSLDKGYIN